MEKERRCATSVKVAIVLSCSLRLDARKLGGSGQAFGWVNTWRLAKLFIIWQHKGRVVRSRKRSITFSSASDLEGVSSAVALLGLLYDAN